MSKMDTLAADISNEIDEKCADTLMRANSHTDSIAKKHRDKIAKIKVFLRSHQKFFNSLQLFYALLPSKRHSPGFLEFLLLTCSYFSL